MLLFIKSISSSEEELTPWTVKHDIEADVNNLRSAFLSIKEDFKNMEKQFNVKFDNLIRYYAETLDRIYFRQFEEETKSESQSSVYDVLEPLLPAEILPKIVFQDFLEFYDEYSYAINERIVKIYGKEFLRVKHDERNIPEFKNKYVGKNDDYIKVKYLNPFYFLNKLEDKLSHRFKIKVSRIRNILYGFNFQDQVLQITYIQVFYKNILRYKHNGGTIDIENCVDSRELPSELKTYKPNIKKGLRKHVSYFFRDFSNLYEYHNAVSKTFTVSKTRFIIYEELLKKYGSVGNFPATIRGAELELFENYYISIVTHENLKLGLCKQVFEHVCYDAGETTYIDWFYKIEAILAPSDL